MLTIKKYLIADCHLQVFLFKLKKTKQLYNVFSFVWAKSLLNSTALLICMSVLHSKWIMFLFVLVFFGFPTVSRRESEGNYILAVNIEPSLFRRAKLVMFASNNYRVRKTARLVCLQFHAIAS